MHEIQSSHHSPLSTTHRTYSEIFFQFNKIFHVNLLLVYFATHCNRHNNKTCFFLTFIEKLQLKRQKVYLCCISELCQLSNNAFISPLQRLLCAQSHCLTAIPCIYLYSKVTWKPPSRLSSSALRTEQLIV